MKCNKPVVCVVSNNAPYCDELRLGLDDIGTHSCVVVDSVERLGQCRRDLNPTIALIDRSLHHTELKSLLKLPGPLAMATFGVADSSSKNLRAIETAARYQLRHPAERIDLERMFSYMSKLAASETSRSPNRSAHLYRGLVGDSSAVIQLRDMIKKIAASRSTVLISGETGTGKEIVARNIHYFSDQGSGPFVPVNCSAIPPELLESELFGHKKGAFTGALADRVGRFELAAGGTLFLDEIGDMTSGLQAKLLRVLEERVIQRVGCNKPIAMTARLVAATHRNLEQRIEKGTFREDLYYRLNVVPIHVPSLRQRKDDIPQLSIELSRRLQREQGMSIELKPAVIKQLQAYDWPGNVRELANLIERLAVICPTGVAENQDLPDRYKIANGGEGEVVGKAYEILSHTLSAQAWPEDGIDLKNYLRSTEANLIKQALNHSDGTMAQAAQLLRVGRTTLVEKVKRLGLSPSEGLMK